MAMLDEIAASRIPANWKSMLNCIVRYQSRRDGACVAAVETVAHDISLSTRQVESLLSQLEEYGLITRRRRRNKPSVVRIDYSELAMLPRWRRTRGQDEPARTDDQLQDAQLAEINRIVHSARGKPGRRKPQPQQAALDTVHGGQQ